MVSSDYNQTILNEMSEMQMSASNMDADLRKKLRVDRIRKMTMGQGSVNQNATQSAVADPSQPDWKKFKTLQEIDMIRQTKKDMIITQVMGDYLHDTKLVAVTPGDQAFVTLPLHN